MKSKRAWSIRQAKAIDTQALIALLAAAVPEISQHTVWQVPWTWQHYLVVVDAADKPVAAGSLQPAGRGKAEIRGVVVSAAWRGAKLGRTLVQRLIERARSEELAAVCVTREPGFFRKFGFADTPPTWVDLRRQPVTPQLSEPRIAMTLCSELAAC